MEELERIEDSRSCRTIKLEFVERCEGDSTCFVGVNESKRSKQKVGEKR